MLVHAQLLLGLLDRERAGMGPSEGLVKNDGRVLGGLVPDVADGFVEEELIVIGYEGAGSPERFGLIQRNLIFLEIGGAHVVEQRLVDLVHDV